MIKFFSKPYRWAGVFSLLLVGLFTFVLLELAQEFQERGCTVAYNLDGGGSATMVFNGEVVNNPTDGRSIEEREVSDIVYFGY